MAPITAGKGPPIMTDSKPKTISIPEAGRFYFDLGRDASYEAAKRGEIPFIQVGRKKRVPVVAMERLLDRAGEPAEVAQ